MKTTFIGTVMAQTPKATGLWEGVLNEINFKRIVELGSYKWGMSLFFYLFCLQKKGEFYTYDIQKFSPPRVIREIGLTKHFYQVDVFVKKKEIGEIIGLPGTTIVYCDGGDKVKEIQTFAKYLKPGDYIAVHDWMHEVFPTDIPKGLTEIFTEECNEEGYTRIFYA